MWLAIGFETGHTQIVDRGDRTEQAEFVEEVQAQNKLSSVTFADDYPVEEHSWVEFPVYGTKYEVRHGAPLQRGTAFAKKLTFLSRKSRQGLRNPSSPNPNPKPPDRPPFFPIPLLYLICYDVAEDKLTKATTCCATINYFTPHRRRAVS